MPDICTMIPHLFKDWQWSPARVHQIATVSGRSPRKTSKNPSKSLSRAVTYFSAP